MARIAGIDLPKNKRGEIGLTYIFGIGRSTAQYILGKAGISVDKKVNEWNDEEQGAIRNIINNEFKVEGALRSEVQMSIKRLLDIACYRGLRPVKVCLCVDSVPVPTAVPGKVSVKQLPVRRRPLRNSEITREQIPYFVSLPEGKDMQYRICSLEFLYQAAG